MRPISELAHLHRGEEAWLFGKGPSLDQFDMQTAGRLRICINESLVIVPEPTYFFAHDEPPIKRVATRWPSSCRAILQPIRGKYAETVGVPNDVIYTYEKREREWAVLGWSADEIAREGCLLGLTGTAHSAIHFCRLIEASSLVFVGMDGKGGYARCIGVASPPGGGQHDRIRRDSEIIAKRLNFSFRFIEQC